MFVTSNTTINNLINHLMVIPMKKIFLLSALLTSSLSQSQVMINEVDADTPGTDKAEFIELYNNSTSSIALTDYELVLYNGSVDAAYSSISLTGQTIPAKGYFVICGDTATVDNCDLDSLPSSNAIQNGADAVALYNGVHPSGISTDNLVDALVYDTDDSDDAALLVLLNADQPQINEDENNAKTTQSNQRCAGEPRNTNTYIQAEPTPGIENICSGSGGGEPADTLGACGETSQSNFKLISEVQGSTDETPLNNNDKIIVEAILTHSESGVDYKNSDYFEFWLQEEDADSDNNSNTSEGIFVYGYNSNEAGLTIGDKVRIEAKPSDYKSQTQLGYVSNVLKCSSDNPLPTAVAVTLPITNKNDFEAVEGMRITSDQGLIVSDLHGAGYGMGNFGQFVLSSKLHYQPTEIALPESAEAAQATLNRQLDILYIDDGDKNYYPEIIPFPTGNFSASNPLRIGNSVTALTGIMTQMTVSFAKQNKTNFTVIPTDITFDTTTNPRTIAPVIDSSANLVITGMNVLNFFNGDGNGSGFPTSRGARSQDGYEMQTAKIVSALEAIDADIIGLMEIENDGFNNNSAIQDLVDALNEVFTEDNQYSFINPNVPKIGTDEISVGLLYRSAKVSLVGNTVLLSSANSPQKDGQPLFIDTKNRPALIQTFEYLDNQFTIAVNHLKSKGSACGEPNEGNDGQANCNIMRTNAADALVQFLATNPTGIETDKVMILGDLNAYSKEDPMQKFYDGGYKNLKYTPMSSESEPYSYSFSGFLGSLDHALATTTLASDVVSVDAWHINSVEDSLMDYQTEANGQKYSSVDNYASPDAYRSSDHDPIIVGLKINQPNTAPTLTGAISTLVITALNQSISINLSGLVSDIDGDTLSFSAQLPAGLSLTPEGILSGVANQTFIDSLPMSIQVEISDGKETLDITLPIIKNIPDSSSGGDNSSGSSDGNPDDNGSDNNGSDDNSDDDKDDEIFGGSMHWLSLLLLAGLIIRRQNN